MKLTRHPLRPVSDFLHAVAMLPFLPLCVARPIERLASRFYYANK